MLNRRLTTPTILPQRLGEIMLLVAFLLVYWLTLDTGLQPYELHGGDLITHQYAQVQARPSNAPGYPLYTMGGWLWWHGWRSLLGLFSDLPPNPLPILSSYSTLWALLALWLLYRILVQLLVAPDRRAGWRQVLSALLISAFFGITYFFWYYATTTEQYSSAVAQTLAIIYVYLQWDRQPQRLRLLFGLAFLCGLALAHMLTVALIVPPLVGVVLLRAPNLLRQPKAVLGAIVAAALPLLGYIYVYVRGALHPEWWGRGEWASPQAWFWAFVSTAQGRNELGWAFESGRTFFGNGFPQYVWQELSVPLLLLGLVGIALLPWRLRGLLYGTLALYLLFCWVYRFGNWFQVALPAYPLILLGLAPIVQWGENWPNRRVRLPLPYAIPFGSLMLVAGLVVALVWRVDQSLPRADSRQRVEDTALARAARLLDTPLPANASLFAAVDDALALSYLTQIWGIQPTATVVSSRDADALLQRGGVVFATWEATPTLLSEVTQQPNQKLLVQGFGAEWVMVGDAAVLPPAQAPMERGTLAHTAAYTVTPTLQLLEATASLPGSLPGASSVPTAPTTIDVVLLWQLLDGQWPRNLAISVRPLNDGAQIIDPATNAPIQQDRPRPVHGLWQDIPGTLSSVADGYRVPLPTPFPDGLDGLLVIIYEQTSEGFRNVAELTLPLQAIAPSTTDAQ